MAIKLSTFDVNDVLKWNKEDTVFTGDKVDIATLVEPDNVADVIDYKFLKSQGATNLEAYNKTGIIQRVDDTGKPIEGRYMKELDDSEASFIKGTWSMSDDDSEKYQFSLDALVTEDFNETIPIEKQNKSKSWYDAFLDKQRTELYKEKLTLKSTLGKSIKHDKLYERYPHLKNVNIELSTKAKGAALGEYDATSNTIFLNPNAFKGKTSSRVLKSLLHEIQHNVDYFADPQNRGGPKAGRSFRLQETTARTTANRMDMTEEERKQTPPFLVTNKDGTQDIDIIRTRENLEQTEMSPNYYKDDVEFLIVDVYDDLLKDEGESGDTTGAADTLKRGLTVETKRFIEKIASNSKGYDVKYSDKDASEEYINYLNYEFEKLEGYKTLPYDVKRAILKEFYNIGHAAITNNKQYSKLKQAIKNSKEGKDVDKIFYELLDTASIGGKASRGLAKRRAETYNKFATEKITDVNQLEDGTLQYLSNDKILFEYTPRKGKHSSSKVGKLTV